VKPSSLVKQKEGKLQAQYCLLERQEVYLLTNTNKIPALGHHMDKERNVSKPLRIVSCTRSTGFCGYE